MSSATTTTELVPLELVRLDARPASKEAAIHEAVALLVAAGSVEPDFEASVLRREAVSETYLGKGVAIPHGMVEDRGLIRKTAIAILQVRDGVEWNAGQVARFVIVIAATSDAHIGVLRRLTRLIQDEDKLARLAVTDNPQDLVDALAEDPAAPVASEGDFARGFDWVIDYPSGLHARPAARWADTAKRFTARLRVRKGTETADARNLVGLLQLGIVAGDSLHVSADGPDATAALAAMQETMTSLSAGEKAQAAMAAAKSAAAPVSGWTPPGQIQSLDGVAAAPGLAIGTLHRLAEAEPQIPDRPVPLTEAAAQLHDALTRTRLQLKAVAEETARRLSEADAAIFKAHAALLDDTDLIGLAARKMVEGHGVAWSWHHAVEETAAQIASVGNALLAARAADLRDVGRRVLAEIDPELRAGGLGDLPEGAILIGTDLSPSDTASLDTTKVAGIATALGGPTSHTAILARTLGLPAMVGGGAGLLALPEGMTAIIDGSAGRLYLDPGEADLAAARAFIAADEKKRAREAEARSLPARTRDGHEVSIGANINTADQAAFAIAQGAEGVGLMRTEFLFIERGDTPDEAAQAAAYGDMAKAMGERPLIIRALDIGGDKQVAHLDLPKEDNPFLGVRGARLLLRRADLLEPQLRALYGTAKEGAKLSIMFPMITSVSEVEALRAACERIRAEIGAPQVEIGIMIEVPAAALMAATLARYVDFFSIGTNDLTQYTLAIDRQNPVLAPEADSLHPAVLRLIRATVEGAATQGRWVGVCGGIAGDPFGAALLTGLGVDELSMTPRDIPAVKARIRDSDHAELKSLAERALDCENAAEVRALDRPRIEAAA
ncbi:phosphoenolpyruvate--protein phosphotransferase [Rhizobiaceae bacterium BDR2-2]|uniref:phosphoenolpyruvate--protein phosphotransferase n=1 Tax=Ectorhizobium quercum TaxID=2965071 RepID=A0AAE3MZS2_9HYPH|nr:phosphoenolpyruvate--protein phosphotransferase [Ectorhizobium quercum]MCX8997362.1 phosphoenolpyruvate--protein phosphotransferase [Ectorhizobium quercum]